MDLNTFLTPELVAFVEYVVAETKHPDAQSYLRSLVKAHSDASDAALQRMIEESEASGFLDITETGFGPIIEAGFAAADAERERRAG